MEALERGKEVLRSDLWLTKSLPTPLRPQEKLIARESKALIYEKKSKISRVRISNIFRDAYLFSIVLGATVFCALHGSREKPW